MLTSCGGNAPGRLGGWGAAELLTADTFEHARDRAHGGGDVPNRAKTRSAAGSNRQAVIAPPGAPL
jgi:hypothetical protein